MGALAGGALMSSRREPAALRIMRTGHGSLNRAAMEYLGWPTRIVIHERYYGLEIRAANDSDHRPYCIPAAAEDQAKEHGYTANFNARQAFTDARMMDADASAKYTALFGLDDDGGTPVLMVCRANRLTVNATRPIRQTRTVPA